MQPFHVGDQAIHADPNGYCRLVTIAEAGTVVRPAVGRKKSSFAFDPKTGKGIGRTFGYLRHPGVGEIEMLERKEAERQAELAARAALKDTEAYQLAARLCSYFGSRTAEDICTTLSLTTLQEVAAKLWP